MMGRYDYFELIRESDDLIYQFDRKERADGSPAYKRRDQDLWISYEGYLGWVAYETSSQAVLGRPWDILPNGQNSDHPPEGVWVSRKGEKSYVYDLQYMAAK